MSGLAYQCKRSSNNNGCFDQNENLRFNIFNQNTLAQIPKYKWMYHQPYGSTVNLEPLFNQTMCNNETPCYWLLPDKTTKYYYPPNENLPPKYLLRSNGTLTIQNIQSSDNGIYHFFQKKNTDWIVSKALLNLRGAPYPTIWLEYWPNVVGALVAMAVVLISFGFILIIDKYRYRPPSNFSHHKRPGTVEPVIIKRANPVFLNDDSVTTTSQKRSRRSSSTSNGTDLRVERL